MRVGLATIRWRSDTKPFERPSIGDRIPSVAPRRTPHPHPAGWRSSTAPSAETATVDLAVARHGLQPSGIRAPGYVSRRTTQLRCFRWMALLAAWPGKPRGVAPPANKLEFS